jgi:hypothetical protein
MNELIKIKIITHFNSILIVLISALILVLVIYSINNHTTYPDKEHSSQNEVHLREFNQSEVLGH